MNCRLRHFFTICVNLLASQKLRGKISTTANFFIKKHKYRLSYFMTV